MQDTLEYKTSSINQDLGNSEKIFDETREKFEFENFIEFEIKSNSLTPSFLFKEKNDSISSEDSIGFINNLFNSKDIILNESWEFSEIIHGKITEILDENVFVDCLIDKENSIIQQRSFPKLLFENLKKFNINSLVIIKTLMKKGAFKLEIYPGDLIVKSDYFDLNNEWSSIENRGLDNKLTEW